MPDPIKIIVEGDADKKFISDYIKQIIPDYPILEDIILPAGGWTTISSQNQGEAIRNQIQQNTDNGGINLIIFDADDHCEIRRDEINKWKTQFSLAFELFLFPNNCDSGALEDLLEHIIPEVNQSIFDCWANYEICLRSFNNSLTTPAKKSKIYNYLEVLLGPSNSGKKKIKEAFRDYKNTNHWDLEAEYLKPLRDFLITQIR